MHQVKAELLARQKSMAASFSEAEVVERENKILLRDVQRAEAEVSGRPTFGGERVFFPVFSFVTGLISYKRMTRRANGRNSW